MEEKKLFADFSPLSAKKWEEKVLKELKGKSLEDLQCLFGEASPLSPYYQQENLSVPHLRPYFNKEANDWGIGEYFSAENDKRANTEALLALSDGINAPCFCWSVLPNDFHLKELFHQIETSFISTHFELPGKRLQLLKTFCEEQQTKGIDTILLRGSINGDISKDDTEGIALLKYAIEKLPRFQVLTVDGKELFGGVENVVSELAELLFKASDLLYLAQKENILPEQTAPRIQFHVYLGTSYFVALAKLRALRILWSLLLKGYGVEADIPAVIAVSFDPDTQVEDRELNLIRASTQAMSAILGGADRLSILPADAFKGEETLFSKRMARNIQHILQMESYFHRVLDPAAGSYYIEELTNKLASEAWKVFQKLEGTQEAPSN